MTPPSRRAAWAISALFGVSALASIGLTVVYAMGGQPQFEGALLGLALGGIAVGLVLWGKTLMPQGPIIEHRPLEPGEPEDLERAEDTLEAGAEEIDRRRLLGRMLGAAALALGAAAIFPVRSLGERPGRSLYRTSWRDGVRLVTTDGEPVRASDLAVEGVLTVFPEGATDQADSQALLLRLPDGLYEPPEGREDWSPDGFVAFSKICTHAGCPVGLYQVDTHELFCPCHQSTFAVLDAAAPTTGPATRRLPQLPLAIEGGFLVARGDFAEPVGPGFWDMGGGGGRQA